MSKVLDEEWRQSETYPDDVFDKDGGDVLFEGAADHDRSASRARLAAQAPAMARLLLAVKRAVDSPSGDVRDDVLAIEREIADVLRAAGVLE